MGLHGGGLSVHSDGIGHGSTFTMKIPCFPGEILPLQVQSSGHLLSHQSSLSLLPAFEQQDVQQSLPSIAHKPHLSYSMNRSESLYSSLYENSNRSSNDRLGSVLSVSSEQKMSFRSDKSSTRKSSIVSSKGSNNSNKSSNNSGSSVGKSIHAMSGLDNFTRVPSLRVLVVDDVELSRKMIIRIYHYENCICDVAINGEDAVKKVYTMMERNCTYDLILMDYEMPNLNGAEAVRQIRALGYMGKVVGVTGHIDSIHTERFVRSGVNRVLVKPVKRDQLLTLLNIYNDHEWAVEEN